jgi:hypothetical protein
MVNMILSAAINSQATSLRITAESKEVLVYFQTANTSEWHPLPLPITFELHAVLFRDIRARLLNMSVIGNNMIVEHNNGEYLISGVEPLSDRVLLIEKIELMKG